MARGGARPGAGRKKGSVSAQARDKKALAARIASEGVTPLEVMAEALRYFHREAHAGPQGTINQGKLMQAVSIAERMAPYVHPKLAAVEHTGADGGPVGFVVMGQPEAEDAEVWQRQHAPPTAG